MDAPKNSLPLSSMHRPFYHFILATKLCNEIYAINFFIFYLFFPFSTLLNFKIHAYAIYDLHSLFFWGRFLFCEPFLCHRIMIKNISFIIWHCRFRGYDTGTYNNIIIHSSNTKMMMKILFSLLPFCLHFLSPSINQNYMWHVIEIYIF